MGASLPRDPRRFYAARIIRDVFREHGEHSGEHKDMLMTLLAAFDPRIPCKTSARRASPARRIRTKERRRFKILDGGRP